MGCATSVYPVILKSLEVTGEIEEEPGTLRASKNGYCHA